MTTYWTVERRRQWWQFWLPKWKLVDAGVGEAPDLNLVPTDWYRVKIGRELT